MMGGYSLSVCYFQDSNTLFTVDYDIQQQHNTEDNRFVIYTYHEFDLNTNDLCWLKFLTVDMTKQCTEMCVSCH